MKVATILIDNIPALKKCVDLHANFVGDLQIISTNEALLEAVRPWADEVPIRFPENPEIEHFFGLGNYAKQLVRTAQRQGMAFSEESYEYGDDGTMDGLIIYDSMNFNFIPRGRKKVLQYQESGGMPIIIDTTSRHFDLFGMQFLNSKLWGITMVHGAEFFGEILIQMLVALKNNYIRDGSPVGVNVFKLKDHTDFTDDDMDDFAAKVQTIADAMMKALKDAEIGKRTEVFNQIPGEVDIDHWTYGAGLQNATGREKEILMVMSQMIGTTGIPIDLVMSSMGGGDWSGEKWRVLYRLLLSSTSTTHGLLIPRMKKRIQNYIVSARHPGAWMDDFNVGFTGPDFTNTKEKAETERTRSETLEKLVGVMAKLFHDHGVPIEMLNQLLTELGFGDLEVGRITDPLDA